MPPEAAAAPADNADDATTTVTVNNPGTEPTDAGDGKPASAKTVLDAAPDDGSKDLQPTATWPDDWREQIAGEDAKELKRLQRFKAPADIFKSYRDMERKLHSGEFQRVLGADATDEDIAQYRKDNGIPDKWEGYYDGFGELVIGDADKPIFDDFLENVAHKGNLPPESAKQVAEWYYSLQQSQQDAQSEADENARKYTEDVLREEWGREYRTNLNVVQNLLARAPDDIRDGFMSARTPDGAALFNSPEFLQFLAGIEREINPAATLVPNTQESGKGIDDQIAEIETFMRTNRTAYNKDEAKQARLRDLYTAREKLQARA